MDWKSKLTSRKFWTAVASFVALLVAAFGGTENAAAQVTAIVMAGATVIAYIVGEGLVDAAAAGMNADIPKQKGTRSVSSLPQAEKDRVGAASADHTGARQK